MLATASGLQLRALQEVSATLQVNPKFNSFTRTQVQILTLIRLPEQAAKHTGGGREAPRGHRRERAAGAYLKASYTSSFRPHTLVASGLIHPQVRVLGQSLSAESSYCSVCVLILLYVSSYYCIYVSSHYYTCVPIRQVHLLQQSLSAECGKSQGLSHELTAVQESIKEQAHASQAAVAEWKQRCTALQADMQQVALPVQVYMRLRVHQYK